MNFIKNFFKIILIPIAILIILWEDLVYKPIKLITTFFERNEFFHSISDKIRNSSPYVAILIFLAGGLPLIPFNLAGIYLISQGYHFLGFITYAFAKIVGGAVTVFLFNLTEQSMRKIKWLDSTLHFIFHKKDLIKAIITNNRYFRISKIVVIKTKKYIKKYYINSYFYKIKQKLIYKNDSLDNESNSTIDRMFSKTDKYAKKIIEQFDKK